MKSLKVFLNGIYIGLESAIAYLVAKRSNVRLYGKVVLLGVPKIRNSGEICIGDGVIIQSHQRYNSTALTGMTFIEVFDNGKLTIGQNTGISNIRISCHSGISIGANCLIGSDTKIIDSDRHPIDYMKRRAPETINANNSIPITIGDDVFVGTSCILLKGTSIGDRVIIGAGSVVSGCIPADQIWAGNPARFIKDLPT